MSSTLLDAVKFSGEFPYRASWLSDENNKVLNGLTTFSEEELLELFILEEDCLESCLFYWNEISKKLGTDFNGVPEFVLQLCEEKKEKAVGNFSPYRMFTALTHTVKANACSGHTGAIVRSKLLVSDKERILTKFSKNCDSPDLPPPSLSSESSLKKKPVKITLNRIPHVPCDRKKISDCVKKIFKRRKLCSNNFEPDAKKKKICLSSLFNSERSLITQEFGQKSFLLSNYRIPKRVIADKSLFVDKTKKETCFRDVAIGSIWQELNYIPNAADSKKCWQFEVTAKNVETIGGKLYFKPEVRYLSTIKREAYFLPSSDCFWPFLVPVCDSSVKYDNKYLTVQSYGITAVNNLFKNKTFPAQLIASNHMLLETPLENLWNTSKTRGRFLNRVLYRPAPAPETVDQASPRDGAIDYYTRKFAFDFYNKANLLPSFTGASAIGSLHNKWQYDVENEIATSYEIPLFGYGSSSQDSLPSKNERTLMIRTFKSAFACHWSRIEDNQFRFCSFQGRKIMSIRPVAGREEYLWKSSENYAFHVIQQRISQNFRVIRPYYSRVSFIPPALTSTSVDHKKKW